MRIHFQFFLLFFLITSCSKERTSTPDSDIQYEEKDVKTVHVTKNEFLLPLTTSFPMENVNFNIVTGPQNALIYKIDSATLSLHILPPEFKHQRQVEAYVKDILNITSSNIRKKAGRYVSMNTIKTQEVEIGKTGPYFYFWLSDKFLTSPAEIDTEFNYIKNNLSFDS